MASRTSMRHLLVLFSALTLLLIPQGSAEDLRFPEDAVTDVTKAPYSAKGDGVTDDTQALQSALSDRKNKLIYLPDGTYLVSAQLRWSKGAKRQILQGQSRDGVTIQLKDEAEGFDDPGKSQGVIWTGEAPAQRFRNSIRNLTIDTGKRNPGASGVQFMANDQGSIDSVRIRCGDRGPVGLDLGYTAEQGSCLIKSVEVLGFDTGISCKEGSSVTFENIRLEDQRIAGFRNDGQCVFIRGLRSKGSAPVFQNAGADGLAVILDSKLEGSGPASEVAAITNQVKATLLVRGLITSGFERAVKNLGGHEQNPDTAELPEWFSHPHLALFPSPERTLNLPVKDAPETTWDAPHDWATVAPLKPEKAEVTLPNGKRTRIWDWTAAIQQTMDSGKPTVYFPKSGLAVAGTIRVPASVRRLFGCEESWSKTSNGTLLIEEGVEPLVIERFDWVNTPMTIRIAGKRPVIVKNVTGGTWEIEANAGDVFFEDVAAAKLRIKPFANVWARQLTVEGNEEAKIINDAGNLWVLGLKAEGDATQIESLNGARTEVLGAFVSSKSARPKPPCWIVKDSSLSVTMAEAATRRSPFRELVVETRDGESRTLRYGEAPERSGGSLLTLFSAFREN